MLNLREYREKPTTLADYLPWALMVAPGIVLNKDGSFQRTARYRGPDLESATAEEQGVLAARLNRLLKRLGGGWALYAEARRRPSRAYPQSRFPDPVSALIDEERRAAFEEDGRHFETETYLTLQYLPPAETTARAEGWFFERPDRGQGPDYRDQLERFEQETEKIFSGLAGFLPEVAPFDDAATLTYLHGTVSAKDYPLSVPPSPVYLDALLADAPLTGGLTPRLGDEHLGVIGLLGLPDTTRPDLMDSLNELAFPYRWVTRFLPLDKPAAEKLLNKYRRQWFAKRKGLLSILKETLSGEAAQLVDTDADNKAADVTGALEELGADLVAYGYVTTSIVLADGDEAVLREKLRAVERVLNGLGIVTIEERLNAVEAWLGTIPGQAYANIRMPLVNSLNLAHLLPVSAPWAGPERNVHLDGPPLVMARTDSATPFRLSTHIGDVGHCLIAGPTGAGKSVLLGLMALQFRRYDGAQVFIFDKGGSSRAAVLAMGGAYLDIGGGAGYQPLRSIQEEPTTGWARDWLLALMTAEGIAVTPEIKEAVWAVLRSLATAPVDQRTLTGFSMLLGDARLRQALAPYCLEGAFGSLLDAHEDRLAFSDVQAFEMEALMERPAAVAPVLSYLFHRLEARFDGRPTLLVLDEAWAYLDHPLFEARLKGWLKTLRKRNVAVVFATQSLADIATSRIAPALIESCPTRILLPNERALEPQTRAAYEGFGLNDRQIRLIAEATPKRHYYLQSVHGCRLFDLDLGPVALALLFATTPDAHRAIDGLLRDHGATGFAAAFFRAQGLSWAADLIANLQDKDTAS